jgi:hypothetical protein
MELVFVSVFNYGCIEIATNHLESLKRNNITNYIAFVTDNESYNELSIKNYNVQLLKQDVINENISNEKKDFGCIDFNKMSYIRYKIINNLLKEGKAVWYLDVDTVVLYNL